VNDIHLTHEEHARGFSCDELVELIFGFSKTLRGTPLGIQRFTASVIAIYAYELSRRESSEEVYRRYLCRMAKLDPRRATQAEIEKAAQALCHVENKEGAQ
jgi:hypothetical protein